MTALKSQMTVFVNGVAHGIAQPLTVHDLLMELGLESKRLAVEINGEIVFRDRRDSTLLSEGDRVEIVHAIGGG
ncbi:sulfur carrier protein ThiS [Halothiobacillus neapolitanus]|uniref:Thiamine biosynthesis protein ThiS n=1 Tax=Halothiobacillus neapolitanus (strain ATCC 23641 / DSM 15147 / CIP 104769 / NCIMB 8539 / c2) TaxID=555778 RepID=D0KW50_HALNC|nr:sulfur carrier protein ThiS [Halothiobacillus neapolitanus]ACX96953.1 thiamine biosynthesis protein ThiS [Halothiobacillus neapolitanus c2]TDN64932.1 sulfur carrier protein ThiS [Halothiobacillus neapolitanus]